MKSSIKILVVEDDADINKLLCDMLQNSGYITVPAYSGTEAILNLKDKNWDMVILDLMLPGLAGERILEKIRSTGEMPVIIISAKRDIETKIQTLRTGADDYITKPFNIEEVSARIDANLRRYKKFSKERNSLITCGEISLNQDTREVFVNQTPISLTTREFEILKLLISYPKKVFTKTNIFETVWGENYLCDDSTIKVHISNLRNKISSAKPIHEYIQTVWGIGYKFQV